MESLYISTTQILSKLKQSKSSLVTPGLLSFLFPHTSSNTRYAMIKRMLQKRLITLVKPGIYYLNDSPPTTYQIAQILVPQSYISLETALNHYGILSQFPIMITSVTPTKTKQFDRDIVYSYSHISPQLFHSYSNVDGALMATPEKALIDYLYLASKGLRNPNIEEFDLSMIKLPILQKYPWSEKYAK